MSNFFEHINNIAAPFELGKWQQRLRFALFSYPAEIISQFLMTTISNGWLTNRDISEDALDSIGDERQLPRYDSPYYIGDGYDGYNYAEKLQMAWDLHSLGGTKTGLESVLETFLDIDHADVIEDNYGVFHIHIYLNEVPPFETWGSFTWGDGTVWGGNVRVQYLMEIIKNFKPVHTHCTYVRVIFPPPFDDQYADLTGI